MSFGAEARVVRFPKDNADQARIVGRSLVERAVMSSTLDTSVITRLGDDVGTVNAATSFLAHFTALLDNRITRIERVFATTDNEAQVLAVMSLCTSAQQAGASTLSALARAALHIDKSNPHELRTLLEQLRVEANHFRHQTQTYLTSVDHSSPT
jgi:hypothetical protein